MSPWLRIRRPLDRVLALLLLIPTVPLLAVLAVLVRRASPGPAFLAVERIGRNGRHFGMWKLRTMYATDQRGAAGGPPLSAGDDPRVTPLGRHLRALRIDELPQLWNVVRGDMTLIGPRPESPAYVDLADPRWLEVLTHSPGIAGPTQVLVEAWESDCLRSLENFEETYTDVVLPVKLAVDRWYVTTATPRTDLAVIASLLGRLGGRRRAVGLARRVQSAVSEVAVIPDRTVRTPDPGQESSEVSRVRDAYGRRSERDWYGPGRHSQQAIDRSRTRSWREGLARRRPVDERPAGRTLEVGCGHGRVLDALEGLASAPVVGVDVLHDRLAEAGSRHAVVMASGLHLPFADGSVDTVVLSTMVSSVLDPALRIRIATEVERVTAADGVICWFDLRYPNPTNRDVAAVTMSQLRQLFPSWELDVRTAVLLPPLARLVDRRPTLADALERLPVLRSHLVGILHRDVTPVGEGGR